MNPRGFTLIELIVVIALMGFLSALGTFGFNAYMKKSQITSQTRTLYGELMQYRLKAFHEKRNYTFKITASGYGIYSSANVTVTPVKSVALKHAVASSDTENVTFDGQGVSTLVTGKAICVAAENEATVDSVVISTSRVLIGKKNGSCDSENITAQ